MCSAKSISGGINKERWIVCNVVIFFSPAPIPEVHACQIKQAQVWSVVDKEISKGTQGVKGMTFVKQEVDPRTLVLRPCQTDILLLFERMCSRHSPKLHNCCTSRFMTRPMALLVSALAKSAFFLILLLQRQLATTPSLFPDQPILIYLHFPQPKRLHSAARKKMRFSQGKGLSSCSE